VTVFEVDLEESEVRELLKDANAGFLQLHIVVVVEVVDAQYAMTEFKTLFCEMEADETGGARNKNSFHLSLAGDQAKYRGLTRAFVSKFGFDCEAPCSDQ
jgi:hypothetical protein